MDTGNHADTFRIFNQAHRPIPRRAFMKTLAGGLGALGTASLLAACGSTPKSQSTAAKSINFQLSWVPDVQFAGSYIAEHLGYYKDYGLEVNLLPGGPSVSVDPVVVAGNALIGINGATSIAQARRAGADLVVVAAGYQKNPDCIVSLKDAPIYYPKDLIGKRIGVPSDSLTSFYAFLKVNHISRTQVNIVPAHNNPLILASHQVDGYYGFITDEPIILDLKGYPTTILSFQDFGMAHLAELYIVTRSSLENDSKRNTIRAFLEGERRGWQKQLSDPTLGTTLAVDIYGKGLGLSYKQQLLEARAQNTLLDTPHGVLWMSKDAVSQTIDTLALEGVTATDSMFDRSIMDEIVGLSTA